MQDTRIRILEATGGLKNRRLLEVGASYGSFLEMAKHRGAKVEAVEIDSAARQHLESIGISVFPRIDGARRYEIVCAFQVIEHLIHPDEFVAELAATLETDGRLLLTLPNAGELDLVGPSWIGLRVDLEHLNYFSVKSLSNLLRPHGLFIEQFWLSSQPGVERRRTVPNMTFWFRAQHAARWLLASMLGIHQGVASGSFVLTVLARRV